MERKLKLNQRVFMQVGNQLLSTICMLMLLSIMMIMPVYATETQANGEPLVNIEKKEVSAPTLGGSGNASKELEQFITGENGFLDIVAQGGMVLVAFGVGQMILAFKDDNAESKSRGVIVLLGGVFCVTIKIILTSLGVGF